MISNPWLKLDNLDFAWGPQLIFSDLNLSLTAGPIVWLAGPSGVGKTTLFRIIAGYHKLQRGSCFVRGKAVTGPGPDRVLVFQADRLFPWMKVCENVAVGMKFQGMNSSSIEERVSSLLKASGLSDAAQMWPRELSSGMRQRINLLRALAVRPHCLLLDEPFSALDARNAARMLDLVVSEIMDNNMRCLISSHDLDLIECRQEPVLRLERHDQVTRFVDAAPSNPPAFPMR